MKRFITFIFSGLLIISCTQVSEYTITGSLDGIDKGTIYLQQFSEGQYITFDSTTVSGGEFILSGHVDVPDRYIISLKDHRGGLPFFLENSVITVTGHADTLFKAKIAGSTVQDEYKSFQGELDKIYEQTIAYYEDYKVARDNGDKSEMARLEAIMDSIYDKASAFQKDFVLQHPASYISPLIVQSISYEMEVKELEEMLGKLDSSLLSATSGYQYLAERIKVLKSVAIGQPAIEFTQNDPDGNPVTLSSLYGKILLIDFWASWCGPCRRENPNVVATYEKFHAKGFDILGVSLDDDRGAWLQAIQDDKLTWTQVSDLKGWQNEVAKLYGVDGIPGNCLLDREGKIIARNLRGEELMDKLEELLGK